MATYKVDALILKKRNYHEADRIITIFGRGTGKETVRAKGVRKSTSKLAGHLETFSRSQLMVAEGKGFDLVVQAQTSEVFHHVRQELPRMEQAFYVLELLDHVTPEGYKDSRLFDLVVHFLQALDVTPEDKLPLLRHAFEMKLLKVVGLAPSLKRSETTGKEFSDGALILTSTGSFIDPADAEPGQSGKQVSQDALKVMQFLLTQALNQAQRLSVPAHILQEIDGATSLLIDHVSEKKIRSRSAFRDH